MPYDKEKPKNSLQQAFLNQVEPSQPFRDLFEHLPGVYFFAKDRESRMMCASRPIYERLGCASEEEIVGTTDYDYFPKQIADSFVEDDQQVMCSGEPLTNHVEIWYNEQRLLDWFVTTKLPIRDASEEIIGVMGTIRSYEGARKSLMPYSDIGEAVDYIRSNHRQRITVYQLAQKSGLSARQLNRKFNEAFGMSAQVFLTKTRIQAASDALLNSAKSITDIAHEFGFCDQSAFTQAFNKHTGSTPLKFRKRYQN